MPFLFIYLGVLFFFAFIFSIPSFVRGDVKVWRVFSGNLFLVVVPLQVFGFSFILIPESKEACGSAGWLPMFHYGKFALWPLVLWASAAYVCFLNVRPKDTYPGWVFFGLLHGTLVATLCSLFGLFVVESITDWGEGFLLFLFVPIYTATAYGIALHHCHQRNRPSQLSLFFHTLFELPFWWWGIVWSRRMYENLPEHSSDCFVVTAASKGHPGWVGPFDSYPGGEGQRLMNTQLYRFREFEKRWKSTCPCSHRSFRRVYNRVGPHIAAGIRSPWLADLVFLILKPAEWIALMFIRKKHI